MYFGVNVAFSLLKNRKVEDDDDDDEEEGDDVTEKVEEGFGSEKKKMTWVSKSISDVKKSVNRLDGIIGYATPKIEIKGYLNNFGRLFGLSVFRQINPAWSVAGNAFVNREKKKKVTVEGGARYVTGSGSAVKVKGNSDGVFKGSYSVKFSECVNALFYGSVNKEFNKNVGFSLVFTK